MTPSPQREPRAPLRCGAIILAAGPSLRMGSPKQLLAIGDKPLLSHAVEAALHAPVWPVVVVLGANASQIRPTLSAYPIIVTENEAWPEGMASSLRAGIATLRQFSRMLDAAIVALCDQPAFSSGTIARLLEAQRDSGRSIIASRYAGRQGAPALFLREHFPALGSLTGEEGARTLLNGDPSQVAAVDLPELAFDIDTPSDYAAIHPPP